MNHPTRMYHQDAHSPERRAMALPSSRRDGKTLLPAISPGKARQCPLRAELCALGTGPYWPKRDHPMIEKGPSLSVTLLIAYRLPVATGRTRIALIGCKLRRSISA